MNNRKITATWLLKTFPDAPSWWIPKDGPSVGSQRWNCRRYSEFLRSRGFEILNSGEAAGSPWWVVHWDETKYVSGIPTRANRELWVRST